MAQFMPTVCALTCIILITICNKTTGNYISSMLNSSRVTSAMHLNSRMFPDVHSCWQQADNAGADGRQRVVPQSMGVGRRGPTWASVLKQPNQWERHTRSGTWHVRDSKSKILCKRWHLETSLHGASIYKLTMMMMNIVGAKTEYVTCWMQILRKSRVTGLVWLNMGTRGGK